MSEKPVQLMIAVFDSEPRAEETLSRLKTGGKQRFKGVQAAVAMRKDDQGQIRYKDVGMSPTKGAVAGIVMGAAVGVATGGAGLVLGALGALLGGVVGKHKREGQIRAEQVNQVVASIPKGSSALLAILEPEFAAEFEDLLQAEGGQTFSADISANLAAQLGEHGETAHAALMEQLEPL